MVPAAAGAAPAFALDRVQSTAAQSVPVAAAQSAEGAAALAESLATVAAASLARAVAFAAERAPDERAHIPLRTVPNCAAATRSIRGPARGRILRLDRLPARESARR